MSNHPPRPKPQPDPLPSGDQARAHWRACAETVGVDEWQVQQERERNLRADLQVAEERAEYWEKRADENYRAWGEQAEVEAGRRAKLEARIAELEATLEDVDDLARQIIGKVSRASTPDPTAEQISRDLPPFGPQPSEARKLLAARSKTIARQHAALTEIAAGPVCHECHRRFVARRVLNEEERLETTDLP